MSPRAPVMIKEPIVCNARHLASRGLGSRRAELSRGRAPSFCTRLRRYLGGALTGMRHATRIPRLLNDEISKSQIGANRVCVIEMSAAQLMRLGTEHFTVTALKTEQRGNVLVTM